jgi:hypothetical protein
LRAFRLVLHGAERGKKKTDQNRDDRDNHKELDEGKAALVPPLL